MRTDILETIRDTFEETKNISIVYMLVQKESDSEEIVYGLYTNHVVDSISFLHIPETSIETEVDGIKIFMLELGSVLRYIYYNGALNFLLFFHNDGDFIAPSSHFLELREYVIKNIPFNIGKVHLISRINKILEEDVLPDDEKMKLYIMSVFDHLLAYVFYDKEYKMPFFEHNYKDIFENWNNKNIVIVINYLEVVKESLEIIDRRKISEKDMEQIDKYYVQVQFDVDNI